mmetsp:Transcript_56224/g.126493  ORF Transcript_56224/g.126493 Transcript_56224/m.126493 type:complete len:775 (-) Transcript_56224:35-2359(-)
MEPDAETQEEWITLTQATLGSCVEKPRLMAERLRKPPFRFLFDIMVEVSRQTGFGTQELFAGAEASSQSAPSTREEKIDFLEHWLLLLGTTLGSSADLAPVSPTDIACGRNPEWTNYMLQCTACAAWPERWSPPAHPVQPHIASTEPDGETAPSHHHSASGFARLKAQARAAEELGTLQVAEGSAHLAAVATVTDGSSLEIATDVGRMLPPDALPPDHHMIASGDAIELKTDEPGYCVPDHHAAASGFTPSNVHEIENRIDLLKSLEEYEALQEEFTRTAEAWKTHNMRKVQEGVGAPVADDDEPDSDDSGGEDAEAPSAAVETRSAVPAVSALNQARMVTNKVDESLAEAQSILASIEEGLDKADAEILKKRLAAEQKRLQDMQDVQHKADAEVAEQAAAAEQAARKKAEKEARRAEKQRRKEERAKELAELAEKPKYPMSRTSAEQGARAVARVGDSDYHMHIDEAEVAQADSSQAMVAAATEAANTGVPVPVLGPNVALFEELKSQLKDTFVSYLAASMPESLLRQYRAQDLVASLQILLTELRQELQQHNLEDIVSEAPTALSEELQQHFPTDWMPHLQTHSPAMLCEKYNNPELVDTLQSFCQIALERLEDNLGPIQAWATESSALRYHDPTPIPKSPVEHEDVEEVAPALPEHLACSSPPPIRLKTAQPGQATAGAGGSTAGIKPMAATMYDKSLGPASWEQPQQQSFQSSQIPVFNKTLGPPIWEQDMPRRVSPSPQTRGAPPTQGQTSFDRNRPATHAAPEGIKFR